MPKKGSSIVIHRNSTRTSHTSRNQAISSPNTSSKPCKNNSPNSGNHKTNKKAQETILPVPTPSPRFHRLKPTSIRKQRTLQDEYFHERKPLMSRTNYLDDSNITLSSFRSVSSNNLKEVKDLISNKPISTLSKVKKRKTCKQNNDQSVSTQGIDVRAITKFYMSNTSQKQKDNKRVEDKQNKDDDGMVIATTYSNGNGNYNNILNI